MTNQTPDTIKAWLSNPGAQERIGRALQGVIDGPAFAEQCIIVSRDETLASCRPESLLSAFLTCAQIGLSPGPHGLVALIPRKGQVDVQIQWQGYKCLMERVDGIRAVVPVLVHASDEFEKRADGSIVHSFDPFDPDRVMTPETVLGGYLRIERTHGPNSYHVVPRSKIDRNRACARSQAVWQKWFPEMCLKTIIRDAWARRAVPYDPAIASHLTAAESHDRTYNDERVDRGVVSVSNPAERALTYEPDPEAEPDPS